MTPPSLGQQKGLAFAPMPFAVISILSSGCVIYHLLFKERQKLERLYHRLVLALNFALIPLSFCHGVWGPFGVPEGTPNFYAASGTIQTCTVQGFIKLTFSMTVPTYYVSLSLQALMGMKYNFREEKYIWIEKYIHIVAYCPSLVLATVAAATQNFNPSGSGCFVTKYPRGCEADSDIPCERGEDIKILEFIVAFSLAMLYFIIPPSVVTAMHCRIRKLRKNTSVTMGMQQVRHAAEEEMMKKIAMQISLYLFSFWFTFMPSMLVVVYKTVTGEMHYDLLISSNCLFLMQGFVMMVVYFSLEKLGRPKVNLVGNTSPSRQELTVEDLRASAKRRSENELVEDASEPRETYVFNVFDGVPDEGSPWARFIDQGDCDGDSADHGGSETAPTHDGDIQQTQRLSKSLSRMSTRGE